MFQCEQGLFIKRGIWESNDFGWRAKKESSLEYEARKFWVDFSVVEFSISI